MFFNNSNIIERIKGNYREMKGKGKSLKSSQRAGTFKEKVPEYLEIVQG